MIKIEHFPQARGTSFTMGGYCFSIAIGKYSRKAWDYWSAPLTFKKTLSTPIFWACILKA